MVNKPLAYWEKERIQFAPVENYIGKFYMFLHIIIYYVRFYMYLHTIYYFCI